MRNADSLAESMVALSSKVPLGKVEFMLRFCSHGNVEDQSAHRGILTAQIQALYASSQSEQLRANEYWADDVVSQGV